MNREKLKISIEELEKHKDEWAYISIDQMILILKAIVEDENEIINNKICRQCKIVCKSIHGTK